MIVNHPKIFYLLMWFYVVSLMPVLQPHAMASDTTRWGVTTNKKLEKHPNTAIDQTGMEAEKDQQNQKNLTSPDGASEKQPEAVVNSTGKAMKSNQSKYPPSIKSVPQADASPSSDETKLEGKNMTPTAKDNKPSTKTMVWVDDHQKMTCQKYLTDLRKWFLKTRHYSIQGASCQTKEFAAAFLQTKDKCIKDCPQGFLSKNGYTDRIVRNITYLEKLGKDRCDNESGAPSMSMPQTK